MSVLSLPSERFSDAVDVGMVDCPDVVGNGYSLRCVVARDHAFAPQCFSAGRNGEAQPALRNIAEPFNIDRVAVRFSGLDQPVHCPSRASRHFAPVKDRIRIGIDFRFAVDDCAFCDDFRDVKVFVCTIDDRDGSGATRFSARPFRPNDRKRLSHSLATRADIGSDRYSKCENRDDSRYPCGAEFHAQIPDAAIPPFSIAEPPIARNGDRRGGRWA